MRYGASIRPSTSLPSGCLELRLPHRRYPNRSRSHRRWRSSSSASWTNGRRSPQSSPASRPSSTISAHLPSTASRNRSATRTSGGSSAERDPLPRGHRAGRHGGRGHLQSLGSHPAGALAARRADRASIRGGDRRQRVHRRHGRGARSRERRVDPAQPAQPRVRAGMQPGRRHGPRPPPRVPQQRRLGATGLARPARRGCRCGPRRRRGGVPAPLPRRAPPGGGFHRLARRPGSQLRRR